VFAYSWPVRNAEEQGLEYAPGEYQVFIDYEMSGQIVQNNDSSDGMLDEVQPRLTSHHDWYPFLLLGRKRFLQTDHLIASQTKPIHLDM
jgi:hypothetical protein